MGKAVTRRVVVIEETAKACLFKFKSSKKFVWYPKSAIEWVKEWADEYNRQEGVVKFKYGLKK